MALRTTAELPRGLYPDFQIEIQIQIETSKAEIVLDADFDQDPPDGKAFYRLSTE